MANPTQNCYGRQDTLCSSLSNTQSASIRSANSNIRIAQDWIPISSGSLKYIRISLAKVGSPTGTITFDIYGAGATPTSGSLLGTSTLSCSILGTSSGDSHFIYFTGITLTAGQQYYIVISGDWTIDNTNYVKAFRGTTSTYASGQYWIDNTGTWGGQTQDLSVAIYDNNNGGGFDICAASISNVAALTALKGSAPSTSDYLYITGGYRVTVASGETLNIKQWVLGDLSTGAAASGAKYGEFENNGTVVYLGDATATNSGGKSSPTTPGTESINCRLIIGNNAIFTNSINALNASNRWIHTMTYGYVSSPANNGTWQANYPYGSPFGTLSGDTSKTSVGHTITGMSLGTYSGISAVSVFSLGMSGIDLAHDFSRNNIDFRGVTGDIGPYIIYGGSGAKFLNGGSVKYDDVTIRNDNGARSHGATAYMYFPTSDTVLYNSGSKQGLIDIRHTTTIPTDLTFTDLFDGTVKVTISNIASYRTLAANGVEDYIQLYDASGNARGGAASKTRYAATLDRKPANCFIVAGVPLSAMAGWYAKATSDNNTYSAASAVASTITPVLLPAANKILTGYGAGQMSAENIGTATPESHTANQVIKSAGGNYNDDNLSVGNVRPVAFGLSQTGNLANLSATDPAYLALEATRNRGPQGGPNSILDNDEVLARGELLPGAYDRNKIYTAVDLAAYEAAQNDTIAPARVENLFPYRNRGEDKIGTFAGGGTVAPGIPSGVKALPVDTESIRVFCSFAAGATSLKIYRALTQTGSYSLIKTVAATSYLDNNNGLGLDPDTEYWYKIKASNSAGDSDYSTAFHARTQAIPTPLSPDPGGLIVT